MKKRLLTFFMALVMVVSVLPSFAYAQEQSQTEKPIESIELQETSVEMEIGDTKVIQATIKPEDATEQVKWTSSKEEVATVADNVITAKGEGDATITSSTKNNVVKTINVKVTKATLPAVNSVTVNAKEASVEAGKSTTVTATLDPKDAVGDDNIVWSLESNEAGATFSPIKGVNTVVNIPASAEAGKTVVVKATVGEKSATTTITVKAPAKKEVGSISVEPKSVEIKEGESKKVTATVLPEDATDKKVTWESKNDKVATVVDGTIKGIKEGTTTVIAKAGEKTAEVSVKVNKAEPAKKEVEKIEIEAVPTLTVGDTHQLKVAFTPTDATDKTLKYKSNTLAVSVSDTGLIKANSAKDSVTITATSSNGKTATVTFKVVDKTPEVSGTIKNVNVYYDGVKGKAPLGTTVQLYKNGIYTGYSSKVDSYGDFSISYSFGYKDYDYYYKNWNYKYYYRYNYNLSDFKLVAVDANGNTVATYNLSSSDANYYNGWYWNNGYYYDRYYDHNRKVYPTSLSLNYGSDVVSGYLTSYPNTYVAVYSNGSYVGSGYTNSNGYFSISLNRYVYRTSDLDFYVGNDKVNVDSNYRIYPWNVNVESYAVSGYYDKNTRVSVYYDGRYIGSDVTDSNGYFRVTSSTRLYDNSLLKFYGPEKSKTETTTKTNTYKTTITIGNAAITQTVNGVTTTKYMDVAPYIKEGRTMLPIRFVAESLGYYVTFNDATRNATFSDGNSVVVINIDSSDFYVDGVKKTFTVKPEIKDGRTMLPISEIGRALGLSHGNKGDNKNIEWDSVNRVVTIETSKSK